MNISVYTMLRSGGAVKTTLSAKKGLTSRMGRGAHGRTLPPSCDQWTTASEASMLSCHVPLGQALNTSSQVRASVTTEWPMRGRGFLLCCAVFSCRGPPGQISTTDKWTCDSSREYMHDPRWAIKSIHLVLGCSTGLTDQSRWQRKRAYVAGCALVMHAQRAKRRRTILCPCGQDRRSWRRNPRCLTFYVPALRPRRLIKSRHVSGSSSRSP